MAGWRKILVVIAFVRTVSALSCTSCDETTCVEPLNCKAGFVKGLCGCCDVCAKLENQRCGGLWYIHGKCANGLKCVTRTQRENQDGFLPDHFKIGVCEPDACQNITCGFRQNCKTNKRGEPVCVCPRGCGKAKHPVCGLLNGRQYRNKCKLRREECFTEMEIGLVNGKCKKCTHKGKEFKFGDSRPDAKPCETCVCHHGLWKCDIQPSCFLNNLPTQSDDLTCLTSQDGKIQVLPCPRGFSCRLPRSDNFHDSLRVGICKRNKATKPKTDLPFLEVNLSMNRIFKKHEEYLSEDGIGERRMPSESEYKETQLFTKMKTTTSAIHSTYVPTTQLRNKQQQNGGLMRRVCFAFPDERRCTSETMVRWYYNATTRNCVEFNYGGCGGNFNNFLSIEICQAVCQSDSHPTAWPSPTIMQPSPVYVSSRKPGENDVSNVLLDMCHDMKSGMSYRDGEKWHVDACTSCSCVSGRGLCIAATCPITCLNPVHVEGRCCPICKPEVDDEIFIDGEDTRCRDTETKLWFQSGESWNKDNCTKCVCFEGEISCMASVCSKTMCSDPIRKDGACCSVCPEGDEQVVQPTKKERNVECKDIDTGKRHLPGEGWNMNDCVSCFCDENGQQMCYESKCSVPKCKNPVHLQGRCCPVCPEAFHSVCVYDNHQYFQGDFMLLRDMCTLCKCNGNMWNCTKKHCNKTVSMFFKRKQTALSKQGPTVNTKSFINTELMENIRTDDSSEDDDDYIIEDPERMTRQFIEKFSLAQDGVEGNNDSRIEMENILKAMLHKNKPTTPFATSEDSQSNSKDKHNDPNKDDIEDPTERISQEETLPWSKDFDDEMWSNWDDPSYTDRFSQDKTDPTDVFGRKHL